MTDVAHVPSAPGGVWRIGRGNGRVDPRRPLRFSFDGKPMVGLAGDTLASALLANGVHLVARSFKYHRPRGILTAGTEEPSALVQLGRGARTVPNLRATEIELHDGLEAFAQNAWPSVNFDAGAINNLLSKVFVAGFYYKTFMHPRSFWMRVYEPLIRRAAGLGRAPVEPDPDAYEKTHAHCDVLVVGSGPAGLAAALAAGRSGARVILADERAELGGSLLDAGPAETLDGRSAAAWAVETVAELASLPEVRLLPRTVVAGYYDGNYLVAVERRADHLPPSVAEPRQVLWKIRAKQVVLCTGAHERPLVFADNDRPGVMLAGAVRSYVNRYDVLPGRRPVVFANHDGAYATALDLAAAGAAVPAVIDVRPEPPVALAARARAAGIEVIAGAAIVATEGAKRVTGVQVMALTPDGTGVAGPARHINCDLVAMSGGWGPAAHLFSQAGGKLRFDPDLHCFVPDAAPPPQQRLRSAGACDGAFGTAAALAAGAEAGAAAARDAGFDAETPALPAAEGEIGLNAGLRPLWVVPGRQALGHGRAKHFVDFQNDVTAADLALAHREGYRHVEHLKRYTTTGMGTDQGKTSNVNALAFLAALRGEGIPAVGTTTFRAPYTPVTFGAIAGRDVGDLADPARVTAVHGWHVARGAVFEDVGQWKRPRYFPRAGEDMDAAVARECRAVRTAVGLLDASTLGKIEVHGPDASAFVNLLYTGPLAKLQPGRARYALLCREDGMVQDDGIAARIDQGRYFLTTSTGNAARVLDFLEDYRQTEFPQLKVWLTSVTEHWSVAQVAGPRARDVLEKVVAPGTDLSAATLPFMTFTDAVVAGVPSKIFRVSFTGELSFEVYSPAYAGRHVWDAIVAAGEPLGLEPFGTEAMHVLRAEKGYVIVGQETDGTVTPLDLGLGWAVSKQKPDFVGKRSLARADALREDRKQLVGILTEDPAVVLPEGAQLTAVQGGTPPVPMVGHVTSSYRSETLGRSIALALVKGGAARHGERLYAPLGDKTVVACTISAPVFYDPEGARVHA